MRMNDNTILITGGATGIGYSMAKHFYHHGNTVVICGRRDERLTQAAESLPGIHTFKCDVSEADERNAFFQYVKDNFPDVNILVNNAGIQRDIDLTAGLSGLNCDEIQINLEAPVVLSAMFTPLLARKDNAAIVNISSGLAFTMHEHSAKIPLYCATKAGLHMFSVTLRIQLYPLGIRVVEIIPPMVESELNTEGRRKRNMLKTPYMMSADEFVGKALAQMEQDEDEVRIVLER